MDVKRVNAEVLGILMALGIEYVNKLPDVLMKYLTQNCDKDSIPLIDSSKPMEEQPISDDAKYFLFLIKVLYMTESKEERDEIIKVLKERTKKAKNT